MFRRFDKATIDNLGGNQNVNFTLVVDEKMADENQTPRARINGWNQFSNRFSQSTSIFVASQGKKCMDLLRVFLQNDMDDKLSPIDISLDFALLEDNVNANPYVCVHMNS